MDRKNRARYESRAGSRGKRSLLGSWSGQSLTEVALLLPVLLLLLLGAIEIGRFAYYAILVGNAAHAGAIYGSQNEFTAADPSGTLIPAAACNDFDGQTTCSLTVTKTYVCGCDNAGTIGAAIDCTTGTCPVGEFPGKITSLRVTASGTFTPLFNYPGVSRSITITRTATMRIE